MSFNHITKWSISYVAGLLLVGQFVAVQLGTYYHHPSYSTSHSSHSVVFADAFFCRSPIRHKYHVRAGTSTTRPYNSAVPWTSAISLASSLSSSSSSFSSLAATTSGTDAAETKAETDPSVIAQSSMTDEQEQDIATASSTDSQSPSPTKPKVIPVTVLSGFLGSGKTTLLQNILQNRQGLKVGVVVNDVASVNVDSKLIKQQQPSSQSSSDATDVVPDGLIELQNGCACCSLGDELLMSVSQLVTLSDLKQDPSEQFQHIVIEVSGVGDPKAIRAQFQDAAMAGMPLMDRIQLDTMVTVVDASMWESYFDSDRIASRSEMPQLYGIDNDDDENTSSSTKTLADFTADDVPDPQDGATKEEWMNDMPPELLKAVLGAINGEQQEREATNGVVDLLVSQVETCDVIVLNKCDLLSEKDDDDENQQQQKDRLMEILQVFNPRATVLPTSFGKIPIDDVLASAHGDGVAISGQVDDHRSFVEAAMTTTSPTTTTTTTMTTTTSHSHSHSHGHDHTHEEQSSKEQQQHSHGHDHDHDHSHSHSSHSHNHDHNHDNEDSSSSLSSCCTDPTCTDPTHSHVHSHEHSHSHNSDDNDAVPHAGIGTFVYRARRPFHPQRLQELFLQKLPISRGLPTSSSNENSNDDEHDNEDDDNKGTNKGTLSSCLRSKGFCWLANSHVSAMYWSHAGKSFELSCLGNWWATLPRDQWPDGVEEYVLSDYDDIHHTDDDYGTTVTTDESIPLLSSSSTVGDRRQEVVFIGPNYFDPNRQWYIQQQLDQCLLSLEEYEQYKQIQRNEQELQSRFVNTMESTYANY